MWRWRWAVKAKKALGAWWFDIRWSWVSQFWTVVPAFFLAFLANKQAMPTCPQDWNSGFCDLSQIKRSTKTTKLDKLAYWTLPHAPLYYLFTSPKVKKEKPKNEEKKMLFLPSLSVFSFLSFFVYVFGHLFLTGKIWSQKF